MKKIILSAALFALASVGTAALAGPPATPAPKKPTPKKTASPAPKKVAEVYCAVTGEKIGDPSKASGGSSTYNGKTYYFCCAGCKPQFDKDPAKYAKAADAKSAAPAAKPAAAKETKKA